MNTQIPCINTSEKGLMSRQDTGLFAIASTPVTILAQRDEACDLTKGEHTEYAILEQHQREGLNVSTLHYGVDQTKSLRVNTSEKGLMSRQ